MRLTVCLTLAGFCLLVQGCATNALKRPQGGAELSPAQRLAARASCFGGLPVDRHAKSGVNEVIVRRGYTLEHSDADKIPLWVCESVDAAQLSGRISRRDVFKADPEVRGAKSYPEDYRGSGYDRGHQAPAGNQTTDPVLKGETFYMSNIAPQRPSLNRGIWKMLEDKTREWVRRYGHAYEWTGPIRCPAQPHVEPAVEEACPRGTIGPNAVTIPAYFYKIILIRDRSKWRAIAFVLPNIDFVRPYRLEQYVQSIGWIEKHTGIEFMPELPARERRELSIAAASMWP